MSCCVCINILEAFIVSPHRTRPMCKCTNSSQTNQRLYTCCRACSRCDFLAGLFLLLSCHRSHFVFDISKKSEFLCTNSTQNQPTCIQFLCAGSDTAITHSFQSSQAQTHHVVPSLFAPPFKNRSIYNAFFLQICRNTPTALRARGQGTYDASGKSAKRFFVYSDG